MSVVTVIRKPFTGTVAHNVLEHTTGGINVGACRITTTESLNGGAYATGGQERWDGAENWRYRRTNDLEFVQPVGRWPGNVIINPKAGRVLDMMSGESVSCASKRNRNHRKGKNWGLGVVESSSEYSDSGGASRFFYWTT